MPTVLPHSFRLLGGLLLTCSVFLTACGGGGTPAAFMSPAEKPGKIGTDLLNALPSVQEVQMLQAVNAVRAGARQCQGKAYPAAPPVTWNKSLGVAARAHALDMAARDYYSHVSPEGWTHARRAEAAGYTNWRDLGENLAAGYAEDQVAEAITDWLGSKEGHCETLMSPALKEMGLGYASSMGGKYSSYWVQDFGTR